MIGSAARRACSAQLGTRRIPRICEKCRSNANALEISSLCINARLVQSVKKSPRPRDIVFREIDQRREPFAKEYRAA